MHCPQCGLQQVSGKVRFCRACGFSLTGVKELVLPDEREAKAERTRFKTAFNQGLGLMLVSLLAVIVLTLLQDAQLIPDIYGKIVAAFLVLAGLIRMFYPYAVGRSGSCGQKTLSYGSDAPIETRKLTNSLSQSHTIPAPDLSWRGMDRRVAVQPPSVTEPTTRLLETTQDQLSGTNALSVESDDSRV